MISRNRKHVKFKSTAVKTIDLPQTPGADCTVKVGMMVYQPPKFSPMYGKVPSRTGEVTRVYLRDGDDRPLVDTHNGHVLEASKCRRSTAKREETEVSS